MPYVTVGEENSGSIDIYYEDHGSGPTVVLSHGWPLSGAAWEKQVAALLDAGYRVIAHDRRGHGRSSKPAIGYDYGTFVADLHALMTKLDLRDATLVGHSMGSAEVFHYVGAYGSERVSRLVLIGALPPFLLKTADNPIGVDQSVFDGIRAAIAKDRHAYTSEFLANFYNTDVFGGTLVSDEVVRSSWNIAEQCSSIGFAACVPAWLTDFRQDIPRIDVPVLIIHGTEDRILPISATADPLHEQVKGSRLVVVDRGSHGLPWTHAELVNAELLAFMKQPAPVTAA
jgi:pimeloyl-ACP methyl ester carboxylesterase